MRVLIFTYSLWVLYLSIAPCCWENDLCFDDPCSDTAAEHHHDHDSSEYPSDAQDQNCSPFVLCGNCSGFVASLSTFLSQKAMPLAPDQATSFFVMSHWASAWLSPVWQPPQSISPSLHS
ncbi:MAG: hypothetical protein AAGE93_24375 [Bacteroidota bacterium]